MNKCYSLRTYNTQAVIFPGKGKDQSQILLSYYRKVCNLLSLFNN